MFKGQWGLHEGTKPISGVEILPLRGVRLHHSVNLMSSPSFKFEGWMESFSLFSWSCLFPSQQTGSLDNSQIRSPLEFGSKNLAEGRKNQAVSKQPKDECTSPLPNLCTGALVFLWDVMRLQYYTVWYPPCFWAVYTSFWVTGLCGIKSDIWSSHLLSLLLNKSKYDKQGQWFVSGDVACCGLKMMTWTCCTYVWSSYWSE